MKTPSESQIEAKLVAYCRERGLLTFKFSSPAHRGVPDRIIIGKGRVMFLELKKKGKRPTALQEHVGKQMIEAGVHWTWADSFANARAAVEDFFLSTTAGLI